MDITLKINNVKVPGENPSSEYSRPHNRYFVKQVTVIPEFQPVLNTSYDSLWHSVKFVRDKTTYQYLYLLDDKPQIKPSAFNDAIQVRPGKAFSAADVQNTYSKLFNYSILRTVKINF